MNDRKVIVLGIDGMDPKMTKRLLDEGRLPNIEKMLKVGAAREDLFMLGGNPTITPPMWTTLSTGAYPMTHGITCYWNTAGNEIGKFSNNFNSAKVKAEQIWQVTAEAEKKTLVWTWPCSWPPVVDNPNLHVVGGTAPQGPNNSNAVLDNNHLIYASTAYTQIENMAKTDLHGGAGCIATDDMKTSVTSVGESTTMKAMKMISEPLVDAWCALDHMEGEEASEFEVTLPRFKCPITEPKNWAAELPAGAREFSLIAQEGMKKYPALLLKNEAGIYDTVAVYTSKKAEEPLVVLKDGVFEPLVVTDVTFGEKKIKVTRHFAILKIDPNGESVAVSVGHAMDIETEEKERIWHPKSLYQQSIDIGGYIPYAVVGAGNTPELNTKRILPSWSVFQKWQAKVLLGLIEQNGYEAVFTHNHACDHIGHGCWRWAKSREKYGFNDEKAYQAILEEIYIQVDEYIGEFLPLLDKNWAIIVTSDHGLLCSEEDELPLLGEGFLMNVGVLSELGYTVMKKDDNGNVMHEIDWANTKAVSPRGNHIYINLKGRNPDGIVDPEDKYELERQIIDDLYNYRQDGKRIVNIAMRNKDAALLGMSGPECGDIIYFLEEGFNRLHGDSLSTTEGYFGTSVAPIFFAAGAGIKKGFYTDRMIREVDVAPTVSSILDLRVPAQCEGAPVYQILEN